MGKETKVAAGSGKSVATMILQNKKNTPQTVFAGGNRNAQNDSL